MLRSSELVDLFLKAIKRKIRTSSQTEYVLHLALIYLCMCGHDYIQDYLQQLDMTLHLRLSTGDRS